MENNQKEVLLYLKKCYHMFMANKVVSITVDVEKATEMMDFYRSYQRVNDGE